MQSLEQRVDLMDVRIFSNTLSVHREAGGSLAITFGTPRRGHSQPDGVSQATAQCYRGWKVLGLLDFVIGPHSLFVPVFDSTRIRPRFMGRFARPNHVDLRGRFAIGWDRMGIELVKVGLLTGLSTQSKGKT